MALFKWLAGLFFSIVLLIIILLVGVVSAIPGVSFDGNDGNVAAASTGSGGVKLSTSGPVNTERVNGITVNRQIAGPLRNMMAAAKADGINLGGWGYRDNADQIRLRKKHCGGSNNYAVYQKPSSQCSPPTARPGFSQHEKGLAVDFTCSGASIGTRSSRCFKWLANNAARYGFYNLPSEPWHWSTTGR